jgi:hypothetical protein
MVSCRNFLENIFEDKLMVITLGQIAFEAYSKRTKGRTYNGKSIPPWDELHADIQTAWMVAAQAVVNELATLDQQHKETDYRQAA